MKDGQTPPRPIKQSLGVVPHVVSLNSSQVTLMNSHGFEPLLQRPTLTVISQDDSDSSPTPVSLSVNWEASHLSSVADSSYFWSTYYDDSKVFPYIKSSAVIQEENSRINERNSNTPHRQH